jgi:hypothetical protein
MLRELLVELEEEGSTGEAEDAGLVREMAPSAIGRAVLLRLARLPEAAGRLAGAVAVLGDCDVRQAAALAGIEGEAAAGAADMMARAGILEAGPQLLFVHPLVRNAIHADLAPSERGAAHREAARLLADAGAEPERVAMHLLESGPAGDDAVVATLAEAAERALDRAAPEAAIRYLVRALAEPAGPRALPALIRMHAAAGVRIGDIALADDFGDDPFEALNTSPDDLLASAWPMAMWLFAAGRADEVPPLFDRAVALASERGDAELALRLEALHASSILLSPAQAYERYKRHADSLVPDSAAERLWLALQGWCGTFLGGDATATEGRRPGRGRQEDRLHQPPPPLSALRGQIPAAAVEAEPDRERHAPQADPHRRGGRAPVRVLLHRAGGLGDPGRLRVAPPPATGDPSGA